MILRKACALLLLVYSFTFALERIGTAEIEKNAALYQSGVWVKVAGVVDTMYDSSTYILSDSTGSIQFELCDYSLTPGDTVEVMGVLDPATRNARSIMEIETKVIYQNSELLWESNPDRSLPEKYENTPENRACFSVKRQQIIFGSIFSTIAIGLPVVYGVMKARDGAESENVDSTHSTSYDQSYTGEMDIDLGLEGIETAAVIVGVTGITVFTVAAITQFVKAAKVPEMELKSNKIEISVFPQVSKKYVGLTVTGTF